MKIRFTTHVIGGYTVGQVAEFPDDQASAYLVAGVAVPVEEVEAIETATAKTPALRTADAKSASAQPPAPKAEAK